MSMSEKEFSRYLALYGANVEEWPESIRAQAVQVRDNTKFATLIHEQNTFETLLRQQPMELPRAGFHERILAAAKYSTPASVNGAAAWVHAFLSQFILPRPAFALASLLMIGMVIGLSAPSSSSTVEEDMTVQNYLENEGTVL